MVFRTPLAILRQSHISICLYIPDTYIYLYMNILYSLILVLILIIIVTIWLRQKFTYWKQLGLSTPSLSFFFNHMKMAFLQENSYADRDKHLYNYFKGRNLKHGGIYFLHLPIYVPTDINIIKHILQVDYHHFSDRGFYVNEEGDPMSAHLFSLGGQKWKVLRKKLTPTFTSGKMKMMFSTLVDCTEALKVTMEKEIGTTVNIKDIMARFTTDVIGSCAFGFSCNSLENPESEFRHKAKDIFHRDFRENIKQVVLYGFPKLMKYLNTNMIHEDVSEFFMDVVKHNVKYREENDVFRRDFMHLLIQLKNKGRLSDDNNLTEEKDVAGKNLTMEEIAAQAFIFFVAGYETSSSTMSFCLYELAVNPHIQDKIRDEINEVLQNNGGNLTYEAIGQMKNLDNVLSETLRKYPPLSSLYRVCTKDYKIPDTDIILKEGTRAVIPIYGIHHDEDFYPNPELFDPERFSEETRATRPDFTYLPFGCGPRVCIGMRFGLLQTKVGLIVLLRNYVFQLSDKTPVPLIFDPESLTLTTKNELWLNYNRLHH